MSTVFENDEDPLVRRGLAAYLTEQYGYKTPIFQLMFDEKLHCDFRDKVNIDASSSGEPKESLKHCVRFGLSRTVFGASEWRRTKSDWKNGNVWLVAYHGTSISNLTPILFSGGLKTWKCVRKLFGEGIYLSPDVHTAKAYASYFGFASYKYQIVLQVSVMGRSISRVVPPSEHAQAGFKSYWLMKNDLDVRITDILLFRADNFKPQAFNSARRARPPSRRRKFTRRNLELTYLTIGGMLIMIPIAFILNALLCHSSPPVSIIVFLTVISAIVFGLAGSVRQ